MRKPAITKECIDWLTDFQDFLECKVLRYLTTDSNERLFAWTITERSPEEHIIELRYGDDDYYDTCEVHMEDLIPTNWKEAILNRCKKEELAREKAELLAREKDEELKKATRRSLYEELKKEFGEE